MFKSMKGLAVPLEKKLRTELVKELAQFEELLADSDTVQTPEPEPVAAASPDLAFRLLPSGRRVYCPNRQYPARNRKHHVRSLLVH
jgi:hypothetical protein